MGSSVGALKGIKNSTKETLKEEKSKSVEEVKRKRSFMLTPDTLDNLDILKLCLKKEDSTKMDLGEIVEASIKMYYEANKEIAEPFKKLYKKL